MKFLEKFSTVVYIIGILSLPIYKTFIENGNPIHDFTSFLSAILIFICYLIGWSFLFTPICVIISSLCWPGKDGSDMRKSCLAHLCMLLIPLGLVYIIRHFSKQTEEIPTKEEKTILRSADIPDTSINVYICSGLNSIRYHAYSDCLGLSRCSGDIEEIGIEEAEEKGYTPCKLCY